MKYVKNDAVTILRPCANCSSLCVWLTTVTVRLDWQESCHDLRQEPEATTVSVLGTTTVRLDWYLSAIQ